MGLVFNERVADELRNRIEKTYNRAMAAGLSRLQIERSVQASTSMFGQPSPTCLNEYEWNGKIVNGIESYHLFLFLLVIYLALELLTASLVVLVI